MTADQRALQIWSLLVCAARDRRIYTYGDIAKILGFKRAGMMGQRLDPVYLYCCDNELPQLTVLVVGKDTGRPGHDLGLDDADKARERVFAFDWFAIEPPEARDFHDARRQTACEGWRNGWKSWTTQ